MSKLYEELRELARDDATIYSYLKTQSITDADDLTVAIALIHDLANQKRIYLNDAIKTRELSVIPQYFKGMSDA